jgi:hypothetical protein
VILGIDHVVLTVADVDAAAAELEERLGLAASAGGRHEALGTENRLVWLGDAFLELVGVFDPDLARAGWFGRPVIEAVERGVGLVTWVIAVDDLADALRWAPPDAGLLGPIDGERRRPDDRIVRWRLARPEAIGPVAPVLIEHDTTAAEWTADERAARAAQTHPLGGRVRLSGLEIRTPSPAPAAGRLRSQLAVAVEPAGRGAVRVRLAAHEVRLVARDDDPAALVDLVADVPLRTRTIQVGDCRIRLRGTAASPVPGPGPEESKGV